ncbi:DUF1802 family protein [Gemmata obscuriglobus]|uniref:DUF1802 domain-containing protein n=1 Tax=Gemmata obscuriglobus TaxID=114 RepID=A0A2Z3H9K0_9BACT|nr:DUF1802 family protein [Gemmata obscuriglobus]AWM41102.1 DUF1802 domain-containing protein [Gemmata obscuriglobus]
MNGPLCGAGQTTGTFEMLSIAFKEWAVICEALAEGRQALILRKGGISEENGEFRPEHAEFLLYPTYFHEHRAGIKPEFLPLLGRAEAAKPKAGTVRFTHFVKVESVSHVTDLESALALDPRHAWTPDVVKQRFNYRAPGLYVLSVRAFKLARPAEVFESPEYAGCKTWVQLDAPVSTEGAEPVAG